MATLFLDLAGTLVDLEAYRRGETVNICFVEPTMFPLLKGVDCVLVTASPRTQVEAVLRVTGLDKSIAWRVLITADEGGDQKASGEPFQNYLLMNPDSAIHVGDSDADEEGAKRAQIPFIRVFPQADDRLQQEELSRALKEALHYLQKK